MVFFAIWWAWVNFTWFASAYDVDDLAYRLLTFVQIVGVLILAAGVASAFDTGNFTVITIGYVVMRVAMVAQWLRAASGTPPRGRPPCATRWASPSCRSAGCSRLFLPQRGRAVGLLRARAGARCSSRLGRAGGTGRARRGTPATSPSATGCSPSSCSASASPRPRWPSTIGRARRSPGLAAWPPARVLLVFSSGGGTSSTRPRTGLRMSRRSCAFFWGYGHYFVFVSLGALGAGLQLAAAGAAWHGVGGTMATTAGLAVAVPVAVYLVVTAVLQGRLTVSAGRATSRSVGVGIGLGVLVLGASCRRPRESAGRRVADGCGRRRARRR